MGNIDSSLIRELETWNIIYDIFIDEEEFHRIDINFDGDGLDSEWKKLSIAEYQQRGKVINILNNVNATNNNLTLNKNPYDTSLLPQKITLLWKYLFIAKKARSILQQNGASEALDAMDEIAEYLLSKLPLTFHENNKKESKKLRTIYYNEISQCYKGYLCVGFAEKALRVNPPGKSPYELLGLYNKAIGLAHHEDNKSREKALKYYDEIINAIKDEEQTREYPESFHKDKCLWKIFVYFPALINKADTLIKLQRGQESVTILREFNNYDTLFDYKGAKLTLDYKKLNAKILLAHGILESSMDNYEQQVEDVIEELYSLKAKKTNLIESKCKFLEAKNYIERISTCFYHNSFDESKKEFLVSHFMVTTDICEELFCDAEANKNSAEQVQTVAYWLDAFQLHLKLKNKGITIENNDDKKNFLEKILNLFISVLGPMDSSANTVNEKHDNYERWVPIKENVIKSLMDVLELFGDNRLTLKEKELIKILINHKTSIKISNYTKAKLSRRLLFLGEKDLEDKFKQFTFPDNIFSLIKNFANNKDQDFYMQKLRLNTESFDKNLIYKSYWPQLKNCYALTVLRKWQSYTPSLGSYSASSRGGGYFIYKVDNEGYIEEGIVVDPGYDFIENFFEHSFSILDISAIVFTHSHIDHSVDFRGLITLIHEMNKRASKIKCYWKQKKVLVIATPSCLNHFQLTLSDTKECIKDIVVMDPEIDITDPVPINYFNIKAMPAYHKEIRNDTNCVGLVIEKKNGRNLIGFTGDTVWTKGVASHLKGCSLVCVNMGAILDVRKGHSFEETFKNEDNIRRLIYNENHLYLPGTITLLNEFCESDTTNLVIIGELGEELKSGLREDLFHRLNKSFKQAAFKIAIEDIGLTVTWDKDEQPKIRCFRCWNPKAFKDISLRAIEDHRNSEQLYYYCKECLKIIESRETGEEKHWQMRYLDQPNT